MKFLKFLTIFIILTFNIFSEKVNKKIIFKSTLKTWNYRLISSENLKQSKWEIEKFSNCTKSSITIKSIKEVPNWSKAYYRFIITKEEYVNENLALKRFVNLKKFPKHINTKRNPEYLLREGFSFENYVYYISTDVSSFKLKELPKLLRLLKTYIKK